MDPTVGFRRLAELAGERPVAAALELGTLLSCVFLFLATLYAIVARPPTEATGLWLSIVVLGAAIVLLWTVVVPLYERFLVPST